MPIYRLIDEIVFPPPHRASESGILAVGGDLSPERLLTAYSEGIFPWYSEGEPILWWSPDPRFVLYPDDLYVSKTMRQVLRRKIFTITCDTCFRDVMPACGRPRAKQKETWITTDMLEAYYALHELGFAHSVEAWRDGKLAGGLYGVSLGRCFFGESMFTTVSNASKAAFITLVRRLQAMGFGLIDCQVFTAHLESLGARSMPRNEFLRLLRAALRYETVRGDWGRIFDARAANHSLAD